MTIDFLSVNLIQFQDKDGNWRAGAIATLIDNVGSVAIASTTGWIKISVDFDISYFSTAKINVRPHTSLLHHSSMIYHTFQRLRSMLMPLNPY